MAASYDGWHGDKNDVFWTWKFDHNPHGEGRIYVGDDDGKLTGCYILNPVTLRIGEMTVPAAQAVDAAVSPDYRGQGVFTKLADVALHEAARDGIQLLFAFPSRGALGGQLRIGFKPQMDIPKSYRLLPMPSRPPRHPALTVGEVHGFDGRFNAFSTKGSDGFITVLHDPAFLQWRYCQHPAETYHTVTCEEDGRICGYAVLTVSDPQSFLARGYIVDLQVLDESEVAARFLVHHSIRWLRSSGARIGVAWDRPYGPEQEALQRAGFSPTYGAIRRRVTRPDFVDQLIVYDAEGRFLSHSAAQGSGSALPWCLVPGDADYI